VLLSAASAPARSLPTLTPRQLVVLADAVVRAVPRGPGAPRRFHVREVLHGTGLRPGDTLTLDDLGPHDLRGWQPGSPEGPPPSPPRVVEALLFLAADAGTPDRGHYRPVSSGLRFLTEGGAVLVPRQVQNPGHSWMTAEPGVDWNALLSQVRADCVAVGRLRAARSLARPGPRSRALLAWVGQHRTEFGTAGGWGTLEGDVFRWVLQSGGPEEGWAAAGLYAELNDGAVLPLAAPAFAGRAGRDLLLRTALAGDRLEGDRVRALELLADVQTLWPAEDESRPGRVLGQPEQAALIDCLTPLLGAGDPALRGAAARALRGASVPRGGFEERASRRALPALAAAYRAEPPGVVRDALAEAVCAVGGPGPWQQLSGNPRGLLALLRDFGHQGGRAFFWLEMDLEGLSVFERPTLVLERLDGDRVAQTMEQGLPAVNLPRPWEQGWDGGVRLLVEFPTGRLTPGTWRARVRGTAGRAPDRVRWAAEPRTFVVEDPAKNPLGG
jgi:hypothetical protein